MVGVIFDCPTCQGPCKCGLGSELTDAVAAFQTQKDPLNRFVKKRVFEGAEFPNLLRWGMAHNMPYRKIKRAIEARIESTEPAP